MGIFLGVAMSYVGKGATASSSLPVLEARFGEARALAVGQGIRTRIVIHNDPADTEYPERLLRHIGIATEEVDADGMGTGEWKIVGSQSNFPDGIFFDHEASAGLSIKVEGANPPSDGSPVTGFGRWKEGVVEFSGAPEAPQPCYYFEFNAEGICIHHGETAPGGAVVLSRGISQEGRRPCSQPDG